LDGLNVEVVYGDLAQREIVDEEPLLTVVSRVEMVIHCAAIIQLGWSKLELSMRVNRDATAALAKACLRKGVRMIHISTVDSLASCDSPEELNDETSVEPIKSRSTYSVSKKAGDDAVLEAISKGLDGVIMHPAFMLGPWDWKPSSGEMILAIAKQRIPWAPGGGFSVADVRDVAEGIVSAMEHGRTGERYILGGNNMTYFDLWVRIAAIVGGKPPLRAFRNWFAATVGRCGDLAGWVTGKESSINSAALAMGQMHHYYSSQKAESELGFRIGSADDAIADAWAWFQAYGYAGSQVESKELAE
jgi:dihydroflavonol-4-reductase